MYVTRDFGHEVLARDLDVPLDEGRTVLRLLRARHDVGRDDLTHIVTTIDGLTYRFPPNLGEEAEQRAVARRLRREGRDPSISTWIFNVNGLESDPEADEFKLFPGDVVQWDLRVWDPLLSVRATVGAFPQPFSGGMYGDRFPTSVLCERPASQACERVKRALDEAGIDLARPGARARRLPPDQIRRARIFVGRPSSLPDTFWRRVLTRGPAGKLFARFTNGGRAIQLSDWRGHPARTLRQGSGLVTAIKPNERELIWLVTGVDDEGVDRAAGAISQETLENAFSVAVDEEGVLKFPLEPKRFEGRER